MLCEVLVSTMDAPTVSEPSFGPPDTWRLRSDVVQPSALEPSLPLPVAAEGVGEAKVVAEPVAAEVVDALATTAVAPADCAAARVVPAEEQPATAMAPKLVPNHTPSTRIRVSESCTGSLSLKQMSVSERCRPTDAPHHELVGRQTNVWAR